MAKDVEIVVKEAITATISAEKRAKMLVYNTTITGMQYTDVSLNVRNLLTLDSNFDVITNTTAGIGNIILQSGKSISLPSSGGNITFTNAATDTITFNSCYTGINETSPETYLHIVCDNGTTGGSRVSGNVGILIDNNHTSAIQLLASESKNAVIYFGDSTNPDMAEISFLNGSDYFFCRINDKQVLELREDGYLDLINAAQEDIEAGRETRLNFRGITLAGIGHTLARIQASHDGTGNDQRGDLIFYTNDGDDVDSPTERMRIDSAGYIAIKHQLPLGLLHIKRGVTTGTVAVGAHLILEGDSDTKAHLQLLTNNGEHSIYFGDNNPSVAGLKYDHDTDLMTLWTNIDKSIYINSNGYLGVNTNAPDSLMHLHKATAGAIAAMADTILTIENSTNAHINFLVGSGYDSTIFFGDVNDADKGGIEYGHDSNRMKLWTNATKAVYIDSNGRFGVNKATAIAAMIHADQSASDGAVPVLFLDQADVDDTFINYTGTSAADATKSISTWTAGNSIQGFFRIEINEVTYWQPYYNAPTS